MTDVDFDSVASQLLKDMGVQDTETLNYFQRKPHSTEWKTSIKVPSPPKARRTKSSGTTYTRQAPKEVPQQNGSGVRRHSVQDKLLRSPQRHSSANGGPAQTSSKQTGGPGGKFGYGSSATEASGKQVSPASLYLVPGGLSCNHTMLHYDCLYMYKSVFM